MVCFVMGGVLVLERDSDTPRVITKLIFFSIFSGLVRGLAFGKSRLPLQSKLEAERLKWETLDYVYNRSDVGLSRYAFRGLRTKAMQEPNLKGCYEMVCDTALLGGQAL